MRNIQLVTIDPQRSFCAVVDPVNQQVLHDGELCVPNAWDDMVRLANFIKKSGKLLSDIHVTMDSHHQFHIAHPVWFKDGGGNHPEPFTLMANDAGRIMGTNALTGALLGEFYCTIPSTTKWTLDYLKSLQDGQRYPHCIWPMHCLIGTKGHTVVEPLFEALNEWCLDNFATINFVTKGSNPKVEHFSAVRSEVIDPSDSTTQLNTSFIDMLMQADEILLSGEALSHCLANTVRDIANEFTVGNLGDSDEFIRKCILLTDCSSNVPGFDQYGQDFINEMTARGMQTTTTADYLLSPVGV